jgi:hypothetical protein
MKIFYSQKFMRFSFVVLSLMMAGLVDGSGDPFSSGRDKGRNQGKASAKTLSWLSNQPVEFLENKGQVLNSEGRPANNVLFKAEAPGVDLYITEKGLSYVFYEADDEDYKKGRKQVGTGKEDRERISYERIDVDLEGGVISKVNVTKDDTGEAYFNFLQGPGELSYYHVKKIPSPYHQRDLSRHRLGTLQFKQERI